MIPETHAVEHWDKIIFKIVSDPSGKIPPVLLNTELDIKVLDEPHMVADIKEKVRRFFQSNRFVDPSNVNIPALNARESRELVIEIIDVEYAICCLEPKHFPQLKKHGIKVRRH